MKITIITVVRNDVGHLESTMQSVLQQTLSEIEYLVIDGDSSDGTVELIKKYSDKLTRWISEPDKGVYDAMNKGVRLANGEWICMMNSELKDL